MVISNVIGRMIIDFINRHHDIQTYRNKQKDYNYHRMPWNIEFRHRQIKSAIYIGIDIDACEEIFTRTHEEFDEIYFIPY